MLEHKRGKKSSHRQVFCKKRVGISAGFYCIWFGISRQRTLRPWGNPLASAGISGKAQCSTARNYTLQSHGVAILHKSTQQGWGHCKQAKKEKTILQHRQWHGIGLSWTAHYGQEFQLTVRQEGSAVGAGLGNKTKYKRPRRCTSRKETFVPLSPQTWNYH